MKRKYITPFDWSKTQLVDAWNEERVLKEKVIAERNVLQSQLENTRVALESALQSFRTQLEKTRAHVLREQDRADAAEAALKRAHLALVVAVEKMR